MKQINKLIIAVLLFTVMAIAFCQNDTNPAPAEDNETKMFLKFQKFMETYAKSYGSLDEFKQRFTIFKENYVKAKEHLKEATVTEKAEFSMGVTQFSDLTEDEFVKSYLMSNVTEENLSVNSVPFNYEEEMSEEVIKAHAINEESDTNTPFLNGRNLQTTIPTSFDWRTKNAVTSVKNQGSCGGCWAFSAAANIEGQYAIKYSKSISLSPQQMIDCDYSNSGCNGGIMNTAFNYVRNAGGLASFSSYPFIGYRGQCRSVAKVAKVSGSKSAGTTNEESIKQFLYKTGPLSITVNSRSWQFYRGGIYNVSINSCPYAPDHGVTLVGYGVANGISYWIIKNSWGPTWGEAGYIRIYRGSGLCGVNRFVYSSVIA